MLSLLICCLLAMESGTSATAGGSRVTNACQRLESSAGQGRGTGPLGRGRLAGQGGAARRTARPLAAAVIPIAPTDIERHPGESPNTKGAYSSGKTSRRRN